MNALKTMKNFFFGISEESYQEESQLNPQASYSGHPGENYGGNGGQKWTGGLSSSGKTTHINQATSLQNGRSVWHQSPQARSLINRRRDITVDKGLLVEPTPAWEVLGITDDEFKEKWVRDNETRFDMYLASKQCHRSGTMTGYQCQRFWMLCDGRDNDQFGRFFYSTKKELVSPVQFDFIDPSMIRGGAVINSNGFQDWVDGIKRDESGKETAYQVWVKKKKGKYFVYEPQEIPARFQKSGRISMIHGYEQEYAGQGRGFSPLHFAVQNLENITDFSASTIKKAINQSGVVGFVEPSADAPASNPYEDQQGGPPLPSFEIQSDPETGEFTYFTSEYNQRQPGSDFIANLGPGEKIKFLQDTSPNAQFDAFVTSIMSWLSSAYNLPIEVVLMKFNSNYSASRAALLMAWQIGRIKQQDIKADLMDYWWESWLSEEIAAGRTQCPGWSDPKLKQAWLKYRLQGSPLPSIDPGKDVAAAEKEMKLSATTQERFARERNGSSAAANMVVNKKAFKNTPHVPWEDEPVKQEDREEDNG